MTLTNFVLELVGVSRNEHWVSKQGPGVGLEVEAHHQGK